MNHIEAHRDGCRHTTPRTQKEAGLEWKIWEDRLRPQLSYSALIVRWGSVVIAAILLLMAVRIH